MGLGAIVGAIGGVASSFMQNRANEKNAQRAYEQQKEFAQSGIQWKVADAEKAGIHPLYALGAQTHSFSPWNVGADYSGIAQAGQNIGRAIQSTNSENGRVSALSQTAQALQVEGLHLDNELKRTQIVSAMNLARQPGTGPGLPRAGTMPDMMGIAGQGNTPQIDGPKLEIEKKIAPINPGQPHAEAGASPEVAYYRTPSGYAPMIPEALAESMESDPIGYLQWMWRNRVSPTFATSEFYQPPKHMRRLDNELYYDPLAGEYREFRRQADPITRMRIWQRYGR